MTEGIVIERKTGGEPEPPTNVKNPAYNQGNIPEIKTEPGSEPPNAQEGEGTASSPHDGGNAPENNPASPTSAEKPREKPRQRYEDRDVSPGTMPDGSHARTSGDRGESYEPGLASKIRGKFALGKK